MAMPSLYERWVLIPLWLFLALRAALYFLRHDWLGGVITIILCFLLGGIGQGLHRNLTARDLFNGEHLRHGTEDASARLLISPEESHMLGKALLYSSWLVAIAVLVLGIHHHLRWWYATLLALAIGILGPVLAMLYVALLSKILGRRR